MSELLLARELMNYISSWRNPWSNLEFYQQNYQVPYMYWKKLTWISGYAMILILRTKDNKLYMLRKQMKRKKTNLWKIKEKVDHNRLRVVLFTTAFSNWSKDFTCSKAWLITGHQHWHLETLSVWQYHKFWKKIQFPEKQSFSMGKWENTELWQQKETSQNKLFQKNIFRNYSKPTTLPCEAKSVKITLIKAVQENPRGFTWIVRKLIQMLKQVVVNHKAYFHL